jgi:NO-binding membrane sensor protein with MHYT domain/nitrogen-specific signal transduction histidine kinase
MAAMNLIGSYNYALVALSVLIAIFASYAALDLAGRVTAAGGWTRAVWLLGGAGAMGTGIWSMHYIGMLAFILPIPVAYHWPTVLLSLFAAILASVIALYVVSRQKMGASRAVAGSVLMGAGIASMHYIGMAAMRLPAICQFNSFLVVLSVVFAVLISLAALWITFHFRDEKTGIGREKLARAVVMGAAIPVMHYTGMAAASFKPSGMPADLSHAVSISTLGTTGIAAVTFIVLGLALLTSWVDRRFAVQTLELQEEKLQRSEAYLAEAQTLSHTGSFGWRVSTGAIIWSEETFRIFQYDRTTKPTVELLLQRVHPDDAAFVKQTIERASQDGKDFDHEYRLVMPDGSVKYVHVVAHALSDESGTVEFVGAVMDVTVAKQAEQALRQAQADLAHVNRVTTMGELTASLAHEVNQPIAAAVTDANTCLRWLTRDQPDLEEARQAASRIVKDATRAGEIIGRIRLLFKKSTPQRALIDVNDVIRDMITLLHSEAARSSISVRTELTDLPQVMGDRVQLQQVLLNLMTNGIDAMRDVDGKRELIICSHRAEDEQLRVSVSDTGVGLPPQQADQIFNAFFTTKPHGSGMGLRISRSIVESHGGRLWAADNSPRGASFHLTLPTKIEAGE